MTNTLSIILTVSWALFIIAAVIYLMASAANERRRRETEARQCLENANRDAINQWLVIYNDKFKQLKAEARAWTAERETYERRIRQLQHQIDIAERMDDRRICKIMELEAQLRELGAKA